ncbi:acyl-CoA dehydrogenase family protein, partial [Chloroflexota bacterium]
MEKDEKGYPLDLWQEMAGLGWLGLIIPIEYGGSGASFLDQAVLLEEMGRACLPGPYFSTVILGGLSILEAGSEKQKRELLPAIAQGKTIITLALTEPSARYDAASIKVSAVNDGSDFIINGSKLFVPDAHVADYIICVAQTKNGMPKEEGLSLFLVEAKSPGISISLLPTMASDKQCEIVFDGVRVPARNLLGELHHGWPVTEQILQKAIVAKCAEMVGGAQQVLEMTVNYAKERVQFNRPIGSFQAIQYACANMAIDVDGCRFVTYQAAWMLSCGLPCTKEVAIAKSWVSEAYRRVTATGLQIHGAIGFTKDHDMQLYYRRAKAAEVLFGDATFQREKIAKELEL